MTIRQWTMLAWGLLGLSVFVCLIVATLSKGRLSTLGTLVSRITATRLGQGLLMLAWMWLGWHAFAR
jgi:hypothetical protein